jgi:serine/threonine-protein phosphatase PP1 catalytic subunit
MLNTIINDTIERVITTRYDADPEWLDFDEEDIRLLAMNTREVFMSKPSLLTLEPPLVICGDIHGQLADLLRIFEKMGYPPKQRYLFLGDLVDRGKHSLEVICLLYALMLKYPDHIAITRGNHEDRSLTKVYGFYDECKRRYSVSLWKTFVDSFDAMPLAAVVAGKIFCVHGGISPELVYLDQVRQIERPREVGDTGLACDLAWSDPDRSGLVSTFGMNEERGISYVFGPMALEQFLLTNSLELLCRAHEVAEEGYEFHFNKRMITIFSAANYTGHFDNSAAVMTVDPSLTCSLTVFEPQRRRSRRSSTTTTTTTRNRRS